MSSSFAKDEYFTAGGRMNSVSLLIGLARTGREDGSGIPRPFMSSVAVSERPLSHLCLCVSVCSPQKQVYV